MEKHSQNKSDSKKPTNKFTKKPFFSQSGGDFFDSETIQKKEQPFFKEENDQAFFQPVQPDTNPKVIQSKSTAENTSNSTTPKTENKTGMPDELKEGVEGLSGIDMSDVKVHYNSDKPDELNAKAYAQGTDIHVGPGQEEHLPHEAWHVVQQKQGRVKPTVQTKDAQINDDTGLEKEADEMGAQAVQMKQKEGSGDYREQKIFTPVSGEVMQMNWFTDALSGAASWGWKRTFEAKHIKHPVLANYAANIGTNWAEAENIYNLSVYLNAHLDTNITRAELVALVAAAGGPAFDYPNLRNIITWLNGKGIVTDLTNLLNRIQHHNPGTTIAHINAFVQAVADHGTAVQTRTLVNTMAARGTIANLTTLLGTIEGHNNGTTINDTNTLLTRIEHHNAGTTIPQINTLMGAVANHGTVAQTTALVNTVANGENIPNLTALLNAIEGHNNGTSITDTDALIQAVKVNGAVNETLGLVNRVAANDTIAHLRTLLTTIEGHFAGTTPAQVDALIQRAALGPNLCTNITSLINRLSALTFAEIEEIVSAMARDGLDWAGISEMINKMAGLDMGGAPVFPGVAGMGAAAIRTMISNMRGNLLDVAPAAANPASREITNVPAAPAAAVAVAAAGGGPPVPAANMPGLKILTGTEIKAHLDYTVSKGRNPATIETHYPTGQAVPAAAGNIDQLWTECRLATTLNDVGDGTAETPILKQVRQKMALNALMVGFPAQATAIQRMFNNNEGHTPRAALPAATEDAYGAGAAPQPAHILARHVFGPPPPIQNIDDLAMRVVRHVGGWCPRKAGAFNTQIDAQNGMQNALNAAIAGGGGTWINWRRSLTQGNSVNDDIVAVSVGTVLELSAAPAPPTTANGRVTVPAMPPYAPVNPGAGNRPLYPGDPNGVALGGPPLTVVVAPTQVHLRINPSNNSPGGFFIHSAWPL